MDLTNIHKAEKEALSFLQRAKELRNLISTASEIYQHPKQSGALRRKSMDLTRALAELRKS